VIGCPNCEALEAALHSALSLESIGYMRAQAEEHVDVALEAQCKREAARILAEADAALAHPAAESERPCEHYLLDCQKCQECDVCGKTAAALVICDVCLAKREQPHPEAGKYTLRQVDEALAAACAQGGKLRPTDWPEDRVVNFLRWFAGDVLAALKRGGGA
jgi:hypothetical protein